MAHVLSHARGQGSAPICLPSVHVISGWHMFADESLGFLQDLPGIEVRGARCFDDWGDDEGGSRWVNSFGGPPKTKDGLIVTHCNKLLSWYPAFAGRYTSAWGKFYGPCKEREIKANPGKDYYSNSMWQVCRPGALKAHDAAMGTGGSGLEATPPMVMGALYGDRVRVLSALRHPVDRLETSFWQHGHYQRHYGSSAAGLHAYVLEQTEAFGHCEAKHGTRRCAFLFELLDKRFSDVFFHCDQLIRGLYEPFIRDWHTALGDRLLVLKAEDLLDRPVEARGRLLHFLGLPGIVGGLFSARPTSYKDVHTASLRDAKGIEMLNSTRALATAFYKPHNARLAELLGDPSLTWGA